MNRNEAIEIVMKNWPNNGFTQLRDALETLIPELRMNEDERIRKEIIDWIKGGNTYEWQDNKDRWIAYLENQKERKPIQFKGKSLVEIIKGEFEGFRSLLKKKGIEYEPQYTYWESFARLFDSSAREYMKEQKPMYFLEIPAGDVAPAEEDGPFDEDEFLEGELSAFLQNYDKEYDNAVVSDVAKHFYEIGKKQKEQQPAEWSEEDRHAIENCEYAIKETFKDGQNPHRIGTLNWLKHLCPQPKEEREPMEIKYAGKIYQVHGVRTLPGGTTGYIIEDGPGHYDCIINPEEVLGGGYGVKQNGAPYPTKESTFDSPRWKPSEEQLQAVFYASERNDKLGSVLRNLYNDLKRI